MIKVKIDGKKVWINGERAKKDMRRSSSRENYFTKNYVIKIEEQKFSIHQCRHEYRLYKRLSKNDKKFFVPILKYGHTKKYDFIIQPLIKFKTGSRQKEICKIVEKLFDKYNLWDYSDRGNWGMDKEKNIKIFDYGA